MDFYHPPVSLRKHTPLHLPHRRPLIAREPFARLLSPPLIASRLRAHLVCELDGVREVVWGASRGRVGWGGGIGGLWVGERGQRGGEMGRKEEEERTRSGVTGAAVTVGAASTAVIGGGRGDSAASLAAMPAEGRTGASNEPDEMGFEVDVEVTEDSGASLRSWEGI